MKSILCLMTILSTVTLLIPGNAAAQQVSSFEQLQLLVKTGDKITVTANTSTQPISGKIIELTPSALKLKANGIEQTFSQTDVLKIQQRRGDSLKNGALWGLGIGGGFVGVTAIAICASEGCNSENAGFLVAAGVAYAGIGAAIGVGIDALIEGKKTIFSADKPATTQLRLTPIISRQRQGVMLSMRF